MVFKTTIILKWPKIGQKAKKSKMTLKKGRAAKQRKNKGHFWRKAPKMAKDQKKVALKDNEIIRIDEITKKLMKFKGAISKKSPFERIGRRQHTCRNGVRARLAPGVEGTPNVLRATR